MGIGLHPNAALLRPQVKNPGFDAADEALLNRAIVHDLNQEGGQRVGGPSHNRAQDGNQDKEHAERDSEFLADAHSHAHFSFLSNWIFEHEREAARGTIPASATPYSLSLMGYIGRMQQED